MKNNEKKELFIWDNPCSEFWKARLDFQKEKVSENYDQLYSLTKLSKAFAESLISCLEFEVKNKDHYVDLDFWSKEYFHYFENVSFNIIHPFEEVNNLIKNKSEDKKLIALLKKKIKKADSVITGFIRIE